jgi:hypothetical protein
MKIKEIIHEQVTPKPEKSASAALPDANDWPDLNQSNAGYLQYKFGIAMAAAPDEQNILPKTATHQNLITIGYTDADQQIMNAAAKALGIAKSRKLTSKRSQETDDVNKTSVVSPRKKNKYGV